MSTPATQIVHWPGKDTPACDEHARKIVALASTMGFPVSRTILLEKQVPCANCVNEEKK